MTGDVTNRDLMLQIQGDRVLTHWREVGNDNSGVFVLTVVHVVETTGHQLRLVNREDKTRQPDWTLSQKLLDRMKPASPNKLNCKWELHVKI